MRKKLLALLAILLCAYCLIGTNIGSIIEPYKEKYLINQDKPSSAQMEAFEAITKEKTFYYYDSLSTKGKEAYVSLYYGFIEHDEDIYFSRTEFDVGEILTAVLYDNPQIFWVDFNYKHSSNERTTMVVPTYRFTVEEAQKMQDEIEKEVDKVISVANTYDSDFEKELYIHDYVISKADYDISTLNNMGDTVYNTLLVGKAICEGYAKTVQMLLDEAGIYNYLVTGNTTNDKGEIEQHMWNVVNIDGENYHLDATWDDLKDTTNIGYFYFNVTDEYISRDHKNISPTGNRCIAKTANYFVKNNSYVSDYNGFLSHIDRSVKVLSSGKNEVVFYFADHSDYERALNDLENDNGFFKYVSKVVSKSGKRHRDDNVDYVAIDDYNYLSVIFKEG